MMKNASGHKTGWNAWSLMQADRARSDFEQRQKRLKHEKERKRIQLDALAKTGIAEHKKKSTILAAMEKARAKAQKKG